MSLIKFFIMAVALYVLYRIFGSVLKKIKESIDGEAQPLNQNDKVSQQTLMACDSCGVHFPSSQMVESSGRNICHDCSKL